MCVCLCLCERMYCIPVRSMRRSQEKTADPLKLHLRCCVLSSMAAGLQTLIFIAQLLYLPL